MFQKGLLLLTALFVLSTINSCLPNCGSDGPTYFVLDAMEIQNLVSESADFATYAPLEADSVESEKVIFQTLIEEVTYVANLEQQLQEQQQLNKPFYGFGSVAMACSPVSPSAKHLLSAIRIFPTEEIEFDAVYASGTDISAFFKLLNYTTQYGLQEYVDLEYSLYEYEQLSFIIAEELAVAYEGAFRFELEFTDGHVVESSSQAVRLL